MKTLLRTGLAAGLLFTALSPARAQAVANGGFENWAVRSSVDSPVDWLNSDDFSVTALGTRIQTGTYTKVTDARSGTYAVRLENKMVTTILGPLVAPGAVALGSITASQPNGGLGLPFTGRPARLQFYYKLTGPQPAVAAEGAFVLVELTRIVNGAPQMVATATRVFSTVTTGGYVLADVPLTYLSAATPDMVQLRFSSGIAALGSNLSVGTVFQVDDVSFTGTAAATRDAALNAALTVAPNPSLDGRYVLNAPSALLAAPLTVLDATGRVVRHEAAAPAAATRVLDLAGLAGGVYTLQVFADKGLITKKLVVQ